MKADGAYREKVILAAAFLHTRPPEEMRHIRSNCARVLEHALKAAGLWDAHYEMGRTDAFHGVDEDYPHVREWYAVLCGLTLREPAEERLMEGAGDLVEPAGVLFTGCWLTGKGEEVARRFLVENEEMDRRLRE